ncbi:2-phospho-L-lactate guanylyltransferase [Jatrophihabitans telluris]|uniref:2-phospho-L-lactate guanylyltransferase n=1 Tax=Jatrophihabitans telluris TaxID=2038343 RepID=A0ABY4R348_9ACTN|nr:2-phospho-L-lactate guanylyltransferase [Jatrophihabitans telluris]UQX89957.1 2-phospho-L-lactate guanylyltransferase [Jatrophihabitans telluris]
MAASSFVAWRILIPVRPHAVGKTRLEGVTRPDQHERLVRAMQADTIAAALAARAAQPGIIAGVVVISTSRAIEDLPVGIELFPDPGTGLNGALSAAAQHWRRAAPGDGQLAMVADLPCLNSVSLLAVLAEAAHNERGFVADRQATGTTMLTAGAGAGLEPEFGTNSAAAHLRSGHVPLRAPDAARADADTEADLQACLRLGVGPHTAEVLALLHPFI